MIIKQLYTESNQANITRVHIDQKFQGGLSGTEVILAQPIDDHGRGLAREVIKLARQRCCGVSTTATGSLLKDVSRPLPSIWNVDRWS
ncbi:MAG: hypothetical protein H6633_11735 [Anaerolineales bacterium]|nr:hypothetical protein [Anaerolineales bacterium]